MLFPHYIEECDCLPEDKPECSECGACICIPKCSPVHFWSCSKFSMLQINPNKEEES